MTPTPADEPTQAYQAYQQAERRLREMLFGDGAFTPGLVKGEERRLEVRRVLRRMREAFDATGLERQRGRVEIAEARIADLESELRKLVTARSRERSDVDR